MSGHSLPGELLAYTGANPSHRTRPWIALSAVPVYEDGSWRRCAYLDTVSGVLGWTRQGADSSYAPVTHVSEQRP